MKVLLANPRGFCAGVDRAIEIVERALALHGKPVYVRHEVVHNRYVVDDLRTKGAVFIEDLDEVPGGAVLVFSAHGVSLAVREEAARRGFQVFDATCPLVTKVHNEAIRYAKAGYQILLVGHLNHQEVVGTRGEAPEAIQVVESPADIANLKIIDPNKLVYLTQTTLSTDDADVIIKALKATFPNLKEPPSSDICYATTNRQRAVRAIAPDADLVLVVGSRNSSNSVRLTEISQNVGTNARLIDDKSELQPEWFDGVKTVLITAGASAPEDLVHDLIVELIERYGGEVEQRDVYHEEVEFGLPGTLKDLMRKRGTDPAHRKVVRQDSGPLLHAWLEERGIQHRTVDLTIGATN